MPMHVSGNKSLPDPIPYPLFLETRGRGILRPLSHLVFTALVYRLLPVHDLTNGQNLQQILQANTAIFGYSYCLDQIDICGKFNLVAMVQFDDHAQLTAFNTPSIQTSHIYVSGPGTSAIVKS